MTNNPSDAQDSPRPSLGKDSPAKRDSDTHAVAPKSGDGQSVIPEAVRKACEEAAKECVNEFSGSLPVRLVDLCTEHIERHVASVLEAALVGMREECTKRCENSSVQHCLKELQQSDKQEWSIGYAAGQRDAARSIRAIPLSVPSLDALRDELIEECCKADCYLCRDGDRPVSTDVSGNGGFIWLHKNNAKCRASNLRALKGAK